VRFDRAADIDPGICAWLATRTVDEAVGELQAAAVPASRLSSMGDVLDEPQLDHRRFWARPEHLGPGARMPAGPFPLGERRVGATAPSIGQHTAEVLSRLEQPEPRPRPQVDLGAVRVLECTLAWAGPLAGRLLGDLGLDVVKVEHPAARTWRGGPRAADPTWRWGELPPPQVRSAVFPRAEPGERPWNRMGIFNKMNRSKRGLCLDAKAADGPEVLRRLVESADVVLHNFSPRGARTLGVDGDAVHRVNPSAVAVAMTGYGTTGPLSGRVSYGPVLQAHAGFDEATGYRGEGPTRLGIAFPDAVGGVHGAFAVLAALWERELTGAGVALDVSQFETLLALGGEKLLATSVTGRDPERPGNRSADAAPQGVYPAAGEDRWVALTVPGDAEWMRLVELVGSPALADLRCAGLAERVEHHDRIDVELAAWTSTRDPFTVTAALQSVGVAACPALTNEDLVGDPHLAERGFLVTLDQPDVGPATFPGFPIHFSRTEVHLRPAPPLGAHNAEVLAEVGYDPDTIARLAAAGVIADRPPAS
jgi:crotonobetainyl-CoA:carnitine CoA-transferase CaiB-like acyl-CoA transferase